MRTRMRARAGARTRRGRVRVRVRVQGRRTLSGTWHYFTRLTECRSFRIHRDARVMGRILEANAAPLTVMLRCRALLAWPRVRAARALGISSTALGKLGHRMRLKWPRASRKKTTTHRILQEGSGPGELVGRLLWKRSPVLFHYWVMFAKKGAATASEAPGPTSRCHTKSRRHTNCATAPPCDPQGAAGRLWAYSFKCEACAKHKVSERNCFLMGHHNARHSYTVK